MSIPTLSLVEEDQASQPYKIPLTKFPLVLGRSASADVRLHDRWASRLHCQIDLCGEDFVLTDLQSTHGTLLNGEPISVQAVLECGDEVTIGLSQYVFRREPEDTEQEAYSSAAMRIVLV